MKAVHPVRNDPIGAQIQQALHLLVVIDGVAQQAKPRRLGPCDGLSVPKFMVANDRLAAQAGGMALPLLPGLPVERVDQQAARQVGLYGQSAFQGRNVKRRQQGRHRRTLPQPRRMLRHHLAGVALGATGGFDLYIEKIAVGDAKAGDGFKRGKRLARIGGAVPASGVELRERVPGVLTRHRVGARRQRGQVRRALQGVVMQQKRDAIAAEFDVTLKHPVPVSGAEAKGGQGVFGGQGAGAPMGDPARIGPGARGGGGGAGTHRSEFNRPPGGRRTRLCPFKRQRMLHCGTISGC